MSETTDAMLDDLLTRETNDADPDEAADEADSFDDSDEVDQ